MNMDIVWAHITALLAGCSTQRAGVQQARGTKPCLMKSMPEPLPPIKQPRRSRSASLHPLLQQAQKKIILRPPAPGLA